MSNVLHVTHRYWPVHGGSEQYLRQIAMRQVRDGNDVTVVTTNAQELSYFWDARSESVPAGEASEAGVHVIRIPVRHLPGSHLSFGLLRYLEVGMSQIPGLSPYAGAFGRWAPYLPTLNSTLDDLGTDWQIVFGWNVTFDGLMAASRNFAERCGSRFIAVPFLHLGEGPHSPVRRYYTMPHQVNLLRAADRVIAQTPVEESFLRNRGILLDRVSIVGAGIDPEALSGGDADAFLRRHPMQRPIICFIGPHTLDKGSIHLLEAAERLWQAGRTFSVVMAGPLMNDFRDRWLSLPSENRARVHLLGTVTEKEKRDLLDATDLLLLPSRTESFGIVLLEAWFYGKPVLAADAGALSAVVEDSVDGYLVPFGDVDAMAEVIADILDNPEQSRQLGNNGRRKTLNTYTWDAVYDRLTQAVSCNN